MADAPPRPPIDDITAMSQTLTIEGGVHAFARPARRKTGSLFVAIPFERDPLVMRELLEPCANVDDLYGDEYDDASDEEPPGAVVQRCTSENVIKCAKPKFRELIVPESAKLAAELGGAPDEEPVIEEKRDIDGQECSVVSYATWLDTQLYGDDLKFFNADFVEFELGPRKILIGQNRGVGKGGHFWDGAYVLAEALVVSPPDALRRNEACSVLELGAGAGLTGIFVGLEHESTKVTLTDGDDGVLDLLRKNCHRNRVQARVAKLVWQADKGDSNTQSEEAWHPSCKEGDDDLQEKFDVIIAAEAVAPIYDARAFVDTLRRHAHAKTDIRLVCKDGRWPDHAAYFYGVLGEHFDFRSDDPVTKLKATYFSVVRARLKA